MIQKSPKGTNMNTEEVLSKKLTLTKGPNAGEAGPSLLDAPGSQSCASRKLFLRALPGTLQLGKCSVLGSARGARCQTLEVASQRRQKLKLRGRSLVPNNTSGAKLVVAEKLSRTLKVVFHLVRAVTLRQPGDVLRFLRTLFSGSNSSCVR